MESSCVRQTDIPGTSRLFADLIYQYDRVRDLFPYRPNDGEALASASIKTQFEFPADRRAALVRALTPLNQGNPSLEVLARQGTVAVVTGQQVGLFSGPAYTVYKALTAIKAARELSVRGIPAVPVFWLATEDHDLEEVSHVALPGPDGSLQTVATATQGLPNAPVGSVRFGTEIQFAVDGVGALLGESEAVASLRACYRPGEDFGTSFARLFTQWFAEWGVILLDASDPELHQIAAPIYRAALERSGEVEEALLARGRELETAGYHQQVKVTPSSSLLFVLHEGARMPIHRRGVDFVIDKENVSAAELLNRLAAAPQDFSGNVLLRPVVQDYLLPTLAYTGGAAEVAYFAQAGVVYQALLGRITPVVPRFSATLIEAKPKIVLERYGLAFTDFFRPEPVREQLAARALSKDLRLAFERAQASTSETLAAIREGLEGLDKTLVEAANNAESKMLHQLESLQARAARAELLQSEILDRKAAWLSNMLYPNKVLQERGIGGIYFLARHGFDLLRGVYEAIHPDCVDHQLIWL